MHNRLRVERAVNVGGVVVEVGVLQSVLGVLGPQLVGRSDLLQRQNEVGEVLGKPVAEVNCLEI